MQTNTRLKVVFCFLPALAFSVACKNESKTVTTSNPTEKTGEPISGKQGQAFLKDDLSKPTVLDIAIGSPEHTTLVAAVQAAELENVLVNTGPLTVFAPTNTAFNALPAGTVDDLLKPEKKAALANILKHHVTPGNYSTDLLKKFKKLGQANDQNVSIEVKGDNVYVGGAMIIASIPAGNGIVHVVDKVIQTPSDQ